MDITALQAEIERLRDLLAENGIDPDPEPQLYGPPMAPSMLSELTRASVRLWSSKSNALADMLMAQYPHHSG
jgi:hypothetical protein